MNLFMLWVALVLPMVVLRWFSDSVLVDGFSYGVMCASTSFCIALWRFGP